MSAKEVRFSDSARQRMLKGVDVKTSSKTWAHRW